MDQEKELGETRTAITSLRGENNRLSQHHQKIQVGGATVREGGLRCAGLMVRVEINWLF